MFDDGSNNVWYDDQGRPHITVTPNAPIGPLANPLPVDVSNLQDYVDTLPSPTHNPLPTHWPYVQTTGEKAASILTGGNGQDRYQLFPERIVRSALSLPTDVASGKVQTPVSGGNKVLSSDEDSEDELLQRVQDMAALMGGGGVAMAPKAGLGTAGGKLVQQHEVPEYLYHATYEPYLNSIKKEGLHGNNAIKNYEDSQPGTVYLAKDPETAKSYAETSDTIPEDYLNKIKVLKVKTSDLNKSKLFADRNVQGNGNTVEYHDTIHPSKLNILKSDNEAAAPIAALEKPAPIFHSAVENAVNTASLKTANPEQWLGTISNAKGVKPEELEWTGLKDWLKEQEGPVSKEQVQQYLEGNKVELKEINKNQPENSFTNEQGTVPKYSKWQLPGAENYREKLLTLPSKSKDALPKDWTIRQEPDGYHYVYNTEGEAVSSGATPAKAIDNAHFEIQSNAPRAEGRTTENYRSSHWDEPNILAHIRMNDRFIHNANGPKDVDPVNFNERNGFKALHIEEIQSDWHQQGREQGYKITDKQKQQLEGIENKLTSGLEEKDIGNPDMDAVLKTAIDKNVITAQEAANYKQWSKGENSNIPDAPFKKTWLDLAAKRMIREAAEQGKDVLSWTPGEAQAARYDLSRSIDKINVNPRTDGFTNERTRQVQAYMPGGRKIELGVDKNGKVDNVSYGGGMPEDQFKGKHLSDIFGKEVAEKIMSSDRQTLSGLDLKVGGEGMHYFYDKMLPNVLEKLTGQKMKVGITVTKSSKPGALKGDIPTNEEKAKINYIDLPQHVKNQAMHKGFPLFSSGLMLSPTEDNPFKRYKLTPVEHDPFEKKEK